MDNSLDYQSNESSVEAFIDPGNARRVFVFLPMKEWTLSSSEARDLGKALIAMADEIERKPG